MHAGRLGRRRTRKKTVGRLPGDCGLGAGPREEKLAALHSAKEKSLDWTWEERKCWRKRKNEAGCLCPHQVGHYLFCMTSIHKTIPEQHGVLDTTRGTEGRSPGCGGEARGWSAGFTQGGTEDARIPVLGSLLPCSLECWELLLQSFKSVSARLERLALANPTAAPPWVTRRWKSTVCSASVLRRRLEGAAGSRGGPGPVP